MEEQLQNKKIEFSFFEKTVPYILVSMLIVSILQFALHIISVPHWIYVVGIIWVAMVVVLKKD